jgi:hypothetical protein
MIDETRHISADARVDDRAVRQLEAPDVTAPDVPAFTLEALLVRDLLARVMNDASVLRNGSRGEYTPLVNFRAPLLNHP